MDGFVEECRKEWKRLGVPDAVVNEMASDLAADLKEAESEGVSPEEVLGDDVFDARAFAASWANERGVVSRPPPPSGVPWRSPVFVAVVVFAILAAVGGGALLGSRDLGRREILAAGRGHVFCRSFTATPGQRLPRFRFIRPPRQQVPPIERRVCTPGSMFVVGPPFVRFARPASSRVGWILFIVGLAGIVVATLAWWVVPGPWSRRRPSMGGTPGGST